MKTTLNLTHEDIQQAVREYIKSNGPDIGNTCIMFQSPESTNEAITISCMIELDNMANNALESSDTTKTKLDSTPKKRVRRTKEQIAEDEANALQQAAQATAAEDKGNLQTELDTGDISELENTPPVTSSLFATA